MQKDTEKTDVIFRVIKIDGITELTALFPHNVETHTGLVACYAHIGQHNTADYSYCVSKSRLATEAECADLKNELENHCGYNLNVVKKRNYNKYLKNYYNLTEIK